MMDLWDHIVHSVEIHDVIEMNQVAQFYGFLCVFASQVL